MARVPARPLPTIDRVLRSIGKSRLPRAIVSVAVQRELAALRLARKSSTVEQVVAGVRKALRDVLRTADESVINGTGLVVPPLRSGSASPTSGSRAELRRRAEKLKLAVEAMPMKTYVGVGKAVSRLRGSKSAGVPVTLEMIPLNLTLAQFSSRLRKGTPPMVGYVADGRFKLDLRTVAPAQDERLFRAVFKAFGL